MSAITDVKAEYSVKKLYEASTGTSIDSSTHESLWGYSVSYLNEIKNGRFRIRITKMTASDFMAAFGKSEDDINGGSYDNHHISGYSISGYLEKWHHDAGWLPLLDWIGEPDSSIEKIEQDMLDMFRSFVTGISTVNLSDDDEDPIPFPSKPKNAKKINPYDFDGILKKNNYDKPKPKIDKNPKKDDDDDDIDWI